MSKFTRVDPVNVKTAHGEEYRDEYTFNEVHVGDIPSDLSTPDGTEFGTVGRVALWKYKDKLLVIIAGDGAYVDYKKLGDEARNQAYFSLSYLASKGYVSGWRKK